MFYSEERFHIQQEFNFFWKLQILFSIFPQDASWKFLALCYEHKW